MKPLFVALCLLLLAGCASTRSPSGSATRTGKINHVVFFKLHDPDDAGELIEDCETYLLPIPGVRSYYVGQHFETGRAIIDSDYDVGAFVAFDSSDAYQAYLTHENHLYLVEKWHPRWEWIRIYDVGDGR